MESFRLVVGAFRVRGTVKELYPFRHGSQAADNVGDGGPAVRFSAFPLGRSCHRICADLLCFASATSKSFQGEVLATSGRPARTFLGGRVNAEQNFPMVEAKFRACVGNAFQRRVQTAGQAGNVRLHVKASTARVVTLAGGGALVCGRDPGREV